MESVDKICADQSGRIVQGDAESSEVTQEPQRKIVALQKGGIYSLGSLYFGCFIFGHLYEMEQQRYQGL
jgi:hypothetical protein